MSNKTPKSSDAKTESAPNQQVPPFLLVLLAIALMVTSYLAYSFLPDRSFDINGQRINVLVANTPSQRAKGLSGRDSLARNQGMLFTYEVPSEYCYWMKDMKFPIDMVWLDQNKKVIQIEENAQPESYPHAFCPTDKAQYVLEIGAGQAKALNIKEGEQAQFKL